MDGVVLVFATALGLALARPHLRGETPHSVAGPVAYVLAGFSFAAGLAVSLILALQFRVRSRQGVMGLGEILGLEAAAVPLVLILEKLLGPPPVGIFLVLIFALFVQPVLALLGLMLLCRDVLRARLRRQAIAWTDGLGYFASMASGLYFVAVIWPDLGPY